MAKSKLSDIEVGKMYFRYTDHFSGRISSMYFIAFHIFHNKNIQVVAFSWLFFNFIYNEHVFQFLGCFSIFIYSYLSLLT